MSQKKYKTAQPSKRGQFAGTTLIQAEARPMLQSNPISRRTLLRALLRGAAGGALLSTLPLSARASLLNSKDVVLTVLGILQPASSKEVFCLLEVLFDSLTTETGVPGIEQPQLAEISGLIRGLQKSGHIVGVKDKPQRRYSMTAKGNRALNVQLRETRDQTRLFLLHGPRALIMEKSRERREGDESGASPLTKLRLRIEKLGRPKGSSEKQRVIRHAPNDDAEMWFGRCRTSPLALSRDADLRFLSFDSISQIVEAGGGDETVDDHKLAAGEIALCLGVSSDMLAWMTIDRRERHYRTFTISKRDGGTRRIESPRIFLKTIQRFILHYLLADQRAHDAVYSFVATKESGATRNAISNALRHVGRRYVATIDISDFFGSLRYRHVRGVFVESELFDQEASHLLARLCTLTNPDGAWSYLPQGAPTSPMISNLALGPFDEEMAKISGMLSVTYTRYADDIAISGDDRRSVKLAALLARKTLAAEPFRLFVNGRKSRFATSDEQQRVTGVVVNEVGLPPRRLRRRVRAMFHRAASDPTVLKTQRRQLRGYLNYFQAFPSYPSDELARYKKVLEQS